MFEGFDPWFAVLALGLTLTLLVAMAAALYFAWPRQEPQHAPQKVIREWEPTGNINFVVPISAMDCYVREGSFLLEVEEDRAIELVGGGRSKEVRFRLATLAEAVIVVRCYSAHAERCPSESVKRVYDQTQGQEDSNG